EPAPGFLIAENDFDHPGDDKRLGNGLREPDRKRRVLVGAARERFLDEQVTRDLGHGAEHAFVPDALLAQPLHHARARALRGHADAAQVPHGAPVGPTTSPATAVPTRAAPGA